MEYPSIRLKLLVTPALAIIWLAVVCGTATLGFHAEVVANERVVTLTEHLLPQTRDAKFLATRLQAELFRFTTTGMIGAPREELQAMSDQIAHRETALAEMIRKIGAADPSPTPLSLALAGYRAKSTDAMHRLLDNPTAGAAAVRDAAVALDAVIDAVDIRERATLASVAAAEAAVGNLDQALKMGMLLLLAIGSPLLILASLLMTQRITIPIRRLTTAMTRLATRDYEGDIPATSRHDEVGSMARAVKVFKEAMMQADTLARERQATQNFLDTVLEHVPATIIIKTADDLRYVYVNRAAETCLRLSRDDMLGRHVGDLVSAEAAARVQERDLEALQSADATVTEAEIIETISDIQRIATVTRRVIPGPDGTPQYLLTMMEDTTDRRRAEQHIAYMAHYDTLTGLPNRVQFGRYLAEAIAAQEGDDGALAVLGLDLDRFKEVNDTLGHGAGDALLREAAARLRDCLRSGDLLARLGGDEFAVVQCGARSVRDAEALAQRLIETVSRPFQIEGQQVFIGLSVGIAIGDPTLDATDLVKQADVALYEAKKGGRGRYRVFTPDMLDRLRQRRTLENELRAAMGTPKLTLHFQPQVDLITGTIVGGEALMRWTSPSQGDVLPGVFVALAEETGLIGPLGIWLFNAACVEAVLWPPYMRVAVNVSPIQFRLPGFLDSVKAALRSSGLAPHRLELEVTEGILLQDTEATLALFTELHELGVQVALDDFGTGYASLSYLQKFNFDKVKIDRSFIRGLVTNANAHAIVRAVVELGHYLGMRTNAEGVETTEELAMLQALGCVEAQGYLFWPPMTAAALRNILDAPTRVIACPPAEAASPRDPPSNQLTTSGPMPAWPSTPLARTCGAGPILSE